MSRNNLPKKSKQETPVRAPSSKDEITDFLRNARAANPVGAGRLIFALDATMSRQPTWDMACEIQASMFKTAGKSGGLSVQLVYFRGFGECKASKWVMSGSALADIMTGIECRGGRTQISKVLSHAYKESDKHGIAALVYVGDAMEEDADKLCHLAGKLGVKGTKTFMFQEGRDAITEGTFREIARLTAGAYMRLNPNSPHELEELLSAVATYAKGGRSALAALKNNNSQILLGQIGK